MKMSAKQDYIWNTMAGLIKAGETVFLTMVATRLAGLTAAGVITIAFAVGNQLLNIGKFGGRTYQVTDTIDKYSWSVYFKERIITVIYMVVCTGMYLVYADFILNYKQDKIQAIVIICMIFAVEAIEDVFWGLYQKKGFLAVGAGIFCIRWGVILLTYLITLWITGNLVYTLFMCLIFSVMVLLVAIRVTYYRIIGSRKILQGARQGEKGQCIKLQLATLPIFVMEFLSLYIGNAPKYAIDKCLNDEVQACYGFVAMPIFVIGLLNTFIYQPTLVQMANEWQENNLDKFKNRIRKQIWIIIGIAAICLTGAYCIGIPVLSLLFATDLMNYKRELMILLLAGLFYAISGYLGVVITIMRRQKFLIGIYGLVALTALLSLTKVVSIYGTIGAAIGHLGLMVLLCILYVILISIESRKTMKNGMI